MRPAGGHRPGEAERRLLVQHVQSLERRGREALADPGPGRSLRHDRQRAGAPARPDRVLGHARAAPHAHRRLRDQLADARQQLHLLPRQRPGPRRAVVPRETRELERRRLAARVLQHGGRAQLSPRSSSSTTTRAPGAATRTGRAAPRRATRWRRSSRRRTCRPALAGAPGGSTRTPTTRKPPSCPTVTTPLGARAAHARLAGVARPDRGRLERALSGRFPEDRRLLPRRVERLRARARRRAARILRRARGGARRRVPAKGPRAGPRGGPRDRRRELRQRPRGVRSQRVLRRSRGPLHGRGDLLRRETGDVGKTTEFCTRGEAQPATHGSTTPLDDAEAGWRLRYGARVLAKCGVPTEVRVCAEHGAATHASRESGNRRQDRRPGVRTRTEAVRFRGGFAPSSSRGLPLALRAPHKRGGLEGRFTCGQPRSPPK